MSTTSKTSKYSRRNFLKSVGAGAALLPLTEADWAEAGCLTTGPKRLLIVAWPNGVSTANGGRPYVTGYGSNYSFAKTSAAPLDPYKSDLLVMDGFEITAARRSKRAGSHECRPYLLTGRFNPEAGDFKDYASGISVDQFVADGLKAKGAMTARHSLTLGALKRGHDLVWREGMKRPVPPNNKPFSVFEDLFGKGIPKPGAAEGDVLQRWAARKSFLDTVRGQLKRYTATLGKPDREKIEAHVESLRFMEDEMGAKPVAGAAPETGKCDLVQRPATMFDEASSDNFPKILRAQMDNAIMAFASDTTRVATIQCSDSTAEQVIFSWLGLPRTGRTGSGVGDDNGHHAISHRGGADKDKVDRWYYEQFAYLIGRLKSIKEGDRTILDNTAVVFVNDAGNGGAHNSNRVPWLLAGSCGGYFKNGVALDVGATPNNGLLVALCNAMGVPTQTFGTAEYGGEQTLLKA